MVIYKISNLMNGKFYIGQTIHPLLNRIRMTHKYNNHLRNAMDLYGYDSFDIAIIERCSSIDELNKREQYWISYYDSTNPKKGYNLQSGGKNCKVHESTKKILSAKCSGWSHTNEAKQKISDAIKGDKHHFYGKKLSSQLPRLIVSISRGLFES